MVEMLVPTIAAASSKLNSLSAGLKLVRLNIATPFEFHLIFNCAANAGGEAQGVPRDCERSEPPTQRQRVSAGRPRAVRSRLWKCSIGRASAPRFGCPLLGRRGERSPIEPVNNALGRSALIPDEPRETGVTG